MTDGVTDDTSLQPPTVGTIIARGLGWGLLLGTGCGYAAVSVGVLLSEGVDAIALFYAVTVFGLAGAVVGAAYGLLAGGAVALVLAPLRNRAVPTVVIRTLSAVAGAAVVAAISFVLVSPDLASDADRITSSALTEATLFYVVPCLSAVIAGYALAPRLLGPGADVVEHHL